MSRTATVAIALTLASPSVAWAAPLALSIDRPSTFFQRPAVERLPSTDTLRPIETPTLGLRLPHFLSDPIGATRESTESWIAADHNSITQAHQRIALQIDSPFPDLAPKRSVAENVPVEFRPLLAPARILADLIVGEVSHVFQGVTWEVAAGEGEHRFDFLRELGDISRGPYTRGDDFNSLPFAVDVRMVLCWRPTSRIKVEGGYAVAYFAGEPREAFGASRPQGDRLSSVLIHGPCAGVSFGF